MRIASLLPSATETLFAMGLGNQVVAVTHECDYPPEAAQLPVVTRSVFDFANRSSAEIEDAVAMAARDGSSLYEVDTEAIRALRPDLVVAQDVCRVCAVPAAQVMEDLSPIRVLRQHPHSLDDVLQDMEALAAACGQDATAFMTSLRQRMASAQTRANERPALRGVFLEWLDPPYPAGHWTPDILELAGLEDPLARPGTPSSAIEWEDVAAAHPDVLVLAPCGWNLQRARQEVRTLQPRIDRVGPRRVVVMDGSAYFNRPGPRLVDTLEALVDNLATN